MIICSNYIIEFHSKLSIYDKRSAKKQNITTDPNLLRCLDRTNTSNRAATRLLAASANALGENVLDTTLSVNTLRRRRNQFREEEAQRIKDNFVPPERAVVHWDGKIMETLSDKLGDHLAVMISGNAPGCLQGKLLSAKPVSDGTGLTEANQVLSGVKEWNCEKNICAMCFDTTSSNTGWKKGAAKNIEEGLGRPLLWLPCRKHMHELFIGDAWQTIFGTDKAPEILQFKAFQKQWDELDKTKFTPLTPNAKLKAKRDDIVKFCQAALQGDKILRDDYKECIELVLVVLGVTPPNFTFKKPGAYHKARWMAHILYGLKIFLFRHQLKRSADQKKRLDRFAHFTSFVYIKHWVLASSARDAPCMDLILYKDLLQYQEFDSAVAKGVLKKLSGHTWYLNQEFVPLSLFSNRVGEDTKAKIAKKLSTVKPTPKYSMGFPSPVALPVTKEEGMSVTLLDFVGTGSLFMFQVLKFGRGWLKRPPSTWQTDPDFQAMQTFVRHLLVCNDTAERGIKLISDYADSLTRNSDQRQFLLQVVEQDRAQCPTANKAALAKSFGKK